MERISKRTELQVACVTGAAKLPTSVPLGLLSYRTSFMSKYQVLCYCSLAKPDSHTKSKTLFSH